MRKFGWVGVLVAIIGMSIYVGTPVAGQQPQQITYSTPPPLVITAFGGKPVDYKAPRTPWGDPDLQGVWSSDNMQGVGTAAGGGPAAADADAAVPAVRLQLLRCGCGGARWSSAAVPRRRGPEGSSGSDHGRGQEKRRSDD